MRKSSLKIILLLQMFLVYSVYIHHVICIFCEDDNLFNFLIGPIVGKERKAIFAKPFEKRISGGLFFKSVVNFVKKQLDLFQIRSRKNTLVR